MIMIKSKHEKKLNIISFVLAAPMAIALIFLFNKWNVVRKEKEQIKNELSMTRRMQEQYDDLLTSVRLREHGYKNHISALQSIKLLEEYKREQNQYYDSICEANKYNKLLFLGDCVVSGYLYQKFCEIENAGVTVKYEVKGCLKNKKVPTYYLVEVLGILIDNAVEAQNGIVETRQLEFQFEEQESQYWFKVLNPYPYVNYDEMESWFVFESSNKGKGRGLGLYYIKKLCANYDMDLLCRNTVYDNKNWIEFAIGIKKADKR